MLQVLVLKEHAGRVGTPQIYLIRKKKPKSHCNTEDYTKLCYLFITDILGAIALPDHSSGPSRVVCVKVHQSRPFHTKTQAISSQTINCRETDQCDVTHQYSTYLYKQQSGVKYVLIKKTISPATRLATAQSSIWKKRLMKLKDPELLLQINSDLFP